MHHPRYKSARTATCKRRRLTVNPLGTSVVYRPKVFRRLSSYKDRRTQTVGKEVTKSKLRVAMLNPRWVYLQQSGESPLRIVMSVLNRKNPSGYLALDILYFQDCDYLRHKSILRLYESPILQETSLSEQAFVSSRASIQDLLALPTIPEPNKVWWHHLFVCTAPSNRSRLVHDRI